MKDAIESRQDNRTEMNTGQKVQTPDGVGIYHDAGPVIGLVAFPYDGNGDPVATFVAYDVRTLAAVNDDTPVTPAQDVEPAPWEIRMSHDYVAEHIPGAYHLEGRAGAGDWELLEATTAGPTHAERRSRMQIWFAGGYTETRVVAPDGSVVARTEEPDHEGFKGNQASLLLHPDDGDFTLNVDSMYYARDALHFAIVTTRDGGTVRGRCCRLNNEHLCVTTPTGPVDLPLSTVASIHYSLRARPDTQ